MAITALPVPAGADRGHGGFKTGEASMLTGVRAGVEITPLLTVGDVLPSGFRFEAIPDGISLRTRGHGRVDVYVNHETAKVPFPYSGAAPTAANGENDFDNAQLSQLTLSQHSAGVLNGSFAISSSAGYQRFCSNFLATRAEGFSRDILFTSEESLDYVYRQEDSWPPVSGDPDEEEIGLVVALDVKTGKHRPIYGMGRLNHENAVAIPGYDKPVVLTGDDTFTSGPLTGVFPAGAVPSQSQVYSYIAPSTDKLLADKGDLWAFVSDTPGVKNYYDVIPGSGTTVTGHFIQVPKNIATGRNADGSELKAADVGFPSPPSNGSWQLDLRSPTTPTGLDGPQWVLEYWSDINDVFQFVRIEDIAYDKRPGHENVVYLVDSGRGRTDAQSLDTPNFKSTNGRVWKMVLDEDDPTIVTSLTVFVEGDDNPVKTLDEVHQPDNIESTPTGLLLTEDPGSSQQFPIDSTDPAATTARLWYVPFSGTPEVVAKVDQSADGGATDVDGRAPGNQGAWETTGIVDASAAFGPGAYLINVQAHTLWVEQAPGDDNNGDGQPDFTYKREGGQLSLIRIPGI
ncbi:MAG: alkaline phosphatase PhoX [Acidimicrobiia bacterium]